MRMTGIRLCLKAAFSSSLHHIFIQKIPAFPPVVSARWTIRTQQLIINTINFCHFRQKWHFYTGNLQYFLRQPDLSRHLVPYGKQFLNHFRRHVFVHHYLLVHGIYKTGGGFNFRTALYNTVLSILYTVIIPFLYVIYIFMAL